MIIITIITIYMYNIFILTHGLISIYHTYHKSHIIFYSTYSIYVVMH